MTPVTGFHSVIESPDSVSRVAPPTSTIAKISAATANSQIRTGLKPRAPARLARLLGGFRRDAFPSPNRIAPCSGA